MTDIELLEAAAKAAGMKVGAWLPALGGMRRYTGTTGNYSKPVWNPLTDDGDALRLAVKLDMIVCVGRVEFGDFDTWEDSIDMPEADVRNDPDAATRRAIVLAAAAIGAKS